MNSSYRRIRTTVSMCNYHFVFCPRYRRKIFLIDGLEDRFKELVYQICGQNGVEILAMECQVDHCHLFVNCPPHLSPADVMKLVKGGTANIIKREFFKHNTSQVWTRSYFVSTLSDVSSDTILLVIDELCENVQHLDNRYILPELNSARHETEDDICL